MNDDTQLPQTGTEAPQQPAEAAGTTLAERGAAIVDAEQQAGASIVSEAEHAAAEAHVAEPVLGEQIVNHGEPNVGTTAPPPNPLPVGSTLAVHGIISKLESEFESEWAKGATAFRTWFGAVMAELKAHVKL